MSETTGPVNQQPRAAAQQARLEKRVSAAVDKIFSSPVKIMMAIGAGLLAIIMLLMTFDVIGRYIFKHPINGSDELVGLLLLCVAACAFSYTQKEKRHIRIDVIIDHIPHKLHLVFNVFNGLLTLGMLSVMTWQMFLAARRFVLGLQSGSAASEVLGIPWYPFLIIMVIGFGIFTLVMLADTIIDFVKAMNK
jgi:TRAP-type transport system small permease protein